MSNEASLMIHGPVITPGDYPLEWLKTALEITGSFEGSNFRTVTGDFDGQGISVGVLQWPYGQGSLQTKILQPYIQKKGTKILDSYFPAPVAITATMTAKQSLAYVRKVMLDGKKLKAGWAAAWSLFLSQEIIKDIQLEAARSIASRAYEDACFANLRSKRAFCWFFDVYVQNGSLKGIKAPLIKMPESISRMMRNILGDKGVTEVPLMPFPVQDQYERNIIENGGPNRDLWLKNKCTDDEGVILFNWIILRVNNNEWRQDVINRKGTIAHMIGKVHGQLYDLREVLS